MIKDNKKISIPNYKDLYKKQHINQKIDIKLLYPDLYLYLYEDPELMYKFKMENYVKQLLDNVIKIEQYNKFRNITKCTVSYKNWVTYWSNIKITI